MTRPQRIRRRAGAITLVCAIGLATARPTNAGDWPNWRGPTGNGTSDDATPPTTWDPAKPLWKIEIPGNGSASPIVVGDKIFVLSAIPAPEPKAAAEEEKADADAQPAEGRRGGRGGRRGGRGGDAIGSHEFVVLCLDRATGKTLWQRTAVETTPHAGHHEDHGFASASPFSDGERVYAHFGSRGLYAFDLAGELAWKKTDFGRMETRGGFGEGSTPTIHGDRIIVPWDHEGESYITALDHETGDVLWKTDRDEPSCWATPLVVEHGGRAIALVSGEKFARGYDIATGKEIWRCAGQTGRPVASPVAGHGLAYIGSGFRGAYLGAFRLGAEGDLATTGGVAWSIDRHTPDVPSLLLVGARLYFHSGRGGILSCLDAPSGKPHYEAQRVPGIGNVYASPVAADGKVYLTARDGVTVVVADADELKVLATNALGEPVDATPALSGRQIYIRGRDHLYAFGPEA